MNQVISSRQSKTLWGLLVLGVLVLMTATCGGGGGGSSPTAPPPPVPVVNYDKTCQGSALDDWCVAITAISPVSGENRRINNPEGFGNGDVVRISFEYTCPWDCGVWADGFRNSGATVELDQFHGGLYPSSSCTEGDGTCATDGLGSMGTGSLEVRCDEALTTTELLLRIHDGPELSDWTVEQRAGVTRDTHRVDHIVRWLE